MVHAISIDQLHVRYAKSKGEQVHAVRGLSLAVSPGEVVGFLGPNGAGKSSTLKALMGFVTPTSGSCSIFGLEAGSPEAKRLVGYLPEVAMYYPFLTPLETMILYGELQGLHGKSLKAEASELLERLGIGNVIHKQNRQVSKGQLQRVGIAQALLGSPKLLILDEVTSGLDPVGRRELRSVLKEKQADGATLFFSSHELQEVEMLCDRILLIDKGQLIETRDVQPLKESLRTYSIRYRGGSDPHRLTSNWQLDGESYSARFESRDELLQGIALVQQSGGTLLDVVAQEGSLEDYFVSTVKEAA